MKLKFRSKYFKPSRILNSIKALPMARKVSNIPGIDSSVFEVLYAGHGSSKTLRQTHSILSNLPKSLIEEFVARYRERDYGYSAGKYFDIQQHVSRAVWQAQSLKLDQANQTLKVLDIGTGFGYFPLACSSMGHNGRGLDLAGKPLYLEVREKLNIPVVEWRVTENNPLPGSETGLDFITAFQPVFYYVYGQTDNEDEAILWNVEQWQLFLKNIHPFINETGRMFLGENTITEKQKSAEEAKRNYFSSLGAKRVLKGWLFNKKDLPTD